MILFLIPLAVTLTVFSFNPQGLLCVSLPIEFIWGKAKPSHKPLLFKKALSKSVND